MKKIIIFIFFTVALFGATNSTNSADASTEQTITIENQENGLEDEFSDDDTLSDIYDPLGSYNRVMTDVNDFFYINILNPVATGYSDTVDISIRKGISNVFNNLFFPIRFVNNVLQLKFANAAEETGRFLINSTIGVLGIFDPAKQQFELEAHKEDFGQTLGFYGVGAGPHIVLPLIGPSNLRDTISLVPDTILNPTTTSFPNSSLTTTEGILIYTVYSINKASLHLGEYENIKEDAIDLYPFIRDLYEQKRISEIKE